MSHVREKIIVSSKKIGRGSDGSQLKGIMNSWERGTEQRSERRDGPGHTEMEEMPSIWQEVCAQKLGGWAGWVLVKVRQSPVPAGRNTGLLSRQGVERGMAITWALGLEGGSYQVFSGQRFHC